MRRSLFTAIAASMLLAGAGGAFAQTSTTTTTTWTPDEGTAITQYSTTQKYESFSDPTMAPAVGMVVPNTVTGYPLPSTVMVESPDRYSYVIINKQPVVIDRVSRKVVHVW